MWNAIFLMCEGRDNMKLRVWWWRDYINGKSMDYYKVSSVEEAIEKIKELTEEDLKNEDIIANACGLEIFENGEWSEYYDEEGRDINEIMEEGI